MQSSSAAFQVYVRTFDTLVYFLDFTFVMCTLIAMAKFSPAWFEVACARDLLEF